MTQGLMALVVGEDKEDIRARLTRRKRGDHAQKNEAELQAKIKHETYQVVQNLNGDSMTKRL
jgi:hypothetical protein